MSIKINKKYKKFHKEIKKKKYRGHSCTIHTIGAIE